MPAAAAKSDEVTHLHLISRLHLQAVQVGVEGLQPVEVAHHHQATEATCGSREAHHAGEGRTHGVPDLQVDVHAIVRPAITPAEA